MKTVRLRAVCCWRADTRGAKASPTALARPRFVVWMTRQDNADSNPLGRASGSFLSLPL